MDEFRYRLFQIGQELTSDDLHSLKFLCKDIIPAGKAERITSPLALFEELERMGKLSKDSPDFLVDCLARIQRIGLRNELLEAAGRCKYLV